jgi:hypothetical protein
MKRTIFLSLIVLFIMGCTTQEKKLPNEGGWKLVFANFASEDLTFPGEFTGAGVKTWTSGTFVFAGKFLMDTVTYDNYGWGTYKLSEGNKYEESIIYHHLDEGLKGTTIKMLMEVRNDTLFQKWPVNDNWQLPGQYNLEKYVRLK